MYKMSCNNRVNTTEGTSGTTSNNDEARAGAPSTSSMTLLTITTSQQGGPTTPSTNCTISLRKDWQATISLNRNNFNNLLRITTCNANTKGENETFGYVLGTKNKKLTHGKTYNKFKKLLMTYVGDISKMEMISSAWSGILNIQRWL